MGDEDSYEVFEDVVCKHVTDNGGVLVKFDDGKEQWLPQKAIHDDSEVFQKGDVGRLCVSHWWLNSHPEFGA